MNQIYIIIKRAFKKKEIYPKIYPRDSKELTKDNLYKSSTLEQIFIHRDNWGIYYIYKKKLSYYQYIAICVFSDRLCTNYNELKLGFRMLISEMSRVKLLIKDNQYLIYSQSTQNQKVNLDIFLRENKDYIDSAFRKSQDIPPIKIDIPKNDIVECIFEDRNSTWITNQIKYGYCNIRITFRDEQPSNIKQNLKSILQRISHILNWIVNNIFKILLIVILLLGIYIFITNITSNNIEEKPVYNNQNDGIKQDTLKQSDRYYQKESSFETHDADDSILQENNKVDKTDCIHKKLQSVPKTSDLNDNFKPESDLEKRVKKSSNGTASSESDLKKRAKKHPSIKYYETNAKHGDTRAYAVLANMYLKRNDYDKAAYWANKAWNANVNRKLASEVIEYLSNIDYYVGATYKKPY